MTYLLERYKLSSLYQQAMCGRTFLVTDLRLGQLIIFTVLNYSDSFMLKLLLASGGKSCNSVILEWSNPLQQCLD